MRDISKALEIIEEFEGFSPTPYLCPAGVATIGFGSTVYPDGREVTLKDKPITENYARELLRHHVSNDIKILDSFIKKHNLTLNNNQYCALVSFVYNLGVGPLLKPTGLSNALKKGDHRRVTVSLSKYVRVRKQGKLVVSNGLVRRRNSEISLYLS